MLFGHGKPDLSLQNIESNHLIWYNLIVEKPTKEAVAIYRQEILQDIRLFTSQPKAKFYDNLFWISNYPKISAKVTLQVAKDFLNMPCYVPSLLWNVKAFLK